nr:receptor-like protein kinase THESEUS 1 [Ipomoea batatas]
MSDAAFTPVDNYLIACGFSENVTFLGQTYVPDSVRSSVSMESEGNLVAATSNSSAPFPIYQSARIFTSTTSYLFDIEREGRHWVRLYFYPLPGHNLTSASITVVTEDFVLLNNFSFKRYNGSYLFKEYAINVTSDSLVLTFIPSNGSVAFINAIEVVSIPDELIPDKVASVSPSSSISGLSGLTLETVYRVNMGGPLITAQNDTLGRTWENDLKYLHVNSSAMNVSVSPSSIKYPASVTPEVAPDLVYATAETMGDANVANGNFNVTWVFSVDPNFVYFVRVHFCDIVSESMNSLVFHLYINEDIALADLDVTNQAGNLDVPYYRDFLSNSSTDDVGILTVSVGPDPSADFISAIMNGLEIMKLSNGARSLDGDSPVETLHALPSRKSKKGVIIISVVGALAALLMIGVCYHCISARRSKAIQQGLGHHWLPLGNSLTLSKFSTISQKSGTTSCISLASPNLGRFFTFQEIMDATNKFDEGLLLGVGMLGEIMDSNLKGKVNPASLKKFGETLEKCLAEHGVDRPSMGDVLWNLEYALQLEETTSALTEPDDNSTNHIPDISLPTPEPFDNSVSMMDGVQSGTDDDVEDGVTSVVFSQLMNPLGRCINLIPTGLNTQYMQSVERSDVTLYLSLPPTTGMATPGFAGFWKSGRLAQWGITVDKASFSLRNFWISGWTFLGTSHASKKAAESSSEAGNFFWFLCMNFSHAGEVQ